ncbi:dead box RNA helicase [Naegleria gruberi]|uniref:Dead box RNA helicase n=1 Tax=Naegleria gruberi TaxID=5762 RepID=D2VZX0_NAEGR|nr:dead box RNA helicase [Naegleria gruberi]EFC37605.1 dead box RNA helicase [Naegleria gruberi]|eukprot:XP_002670349.1 dead box RNA helicase [Naegleria gruberi strain NEG-M]
MFSNKDNDPLAVIDRLLPRSSGSRSLSYLNSQEEFNSNFDVLISPPRLSNTIREKTIGSNTLQLFDETTSYYELFPIIENKRKKNTSDDLLKFGITWESFVKPKISFKNANQHNKDFDRRIEEQNGKNLLEKFLTMLQEQLRLDQISSNKYGVASGLSKQQVACLIAKQLYIAKRKFKNTLSVKSVFKDLQNMGIGLSLDPKTQKLEQIVKEVHILKVLEHLEKLMDWIDRYAKPNLAEEEAKRYGKVERLIIGTGESKNTNTYFSTGTEKDNDEYDDEALVIDENIEFGSADDITNADHLHNQFRNISIFSRSQLENVLDQTNLFSFTAPTENVEEEEEEEEESVLSSMYTVDWLEKEARKICKTPGIENIVLDILQKKGQDAVQLQSRLFDALGENAFELMSIIMEHKSEILADLYRMQMADNAVEGINSFSHVKMTTSKFKDAQKKLKKEGRKIGRKNQTKFNLSGGNSENELNELKSLYQTFKKEKDRNVLKAGEGESRVLVLGRDVIPESNNEADKETQERVIRQPTYEEHVFPAPKKREDNTPLVPISIFEDWAQLAFKGYTHLNRVQSDVFYSAYKTSENMLVCAPTGCGKTNIAMMTVLREIGQHFKGGKIRREEFKIIYIAPMKALAAEMVENFSKRLAPLGITVKEMTGDMQLTKREVQQTQMIVTTPEKWDVTTRKASDQALIQLTRLIIIDEVHLLNEDRGPVIESIVARTLRQVETTQSMIRLVGLSATLPNYMDVANFLRVDPHSGLHFFDGSYRPVPLEQSFIGVSIRNPIARNKEYNQIAFNRTLKNLKREKQVMVFVHSRKETSTTAKALIDLAVEENALDMLTAGVKMSEHTRKWVTKSLEKCHNRELKELVPKGLGIHHAGLVRSDRNLVEKLFSEGIIRVLCCTSTLAWGVNLPSYCCIIKGTEVYNAEKSTMTELGMLDIMQIFGRAGRPQFDVEGEGVIITSYEVLPRYLNLLKRNLPIESQMTQDLANHLCAEIVLGTVSNVREGCLWLNYTYLFLRMRQNPMNYGILPEEVKLDPSLIGMRKSLIEKACKMLQESKMIIYDERTGVVSATDLGRIASHFYIHYETIQLYNEKLHPKMSESDVLHIVASAREFKNIKVREDESEELAELSANAPVKVTKGQDEFTGKVNLLIQSYISHVKIKNSSLISDCAFIIQSVGRIIRAIFEIAIKERWSSLVDKLLTLTKCMERRQWVFEHPLRQMSKIPTFALQKLENKNLTLSKLVEYEESELDQVLNVRGMGRIIMEHIDRFPHLDLEANVQPITRNVLRFQVKIRPNFTWDKKLHGETEPWWIWVEDENSEFIYHSEYFLLKHDEYEKMMKESRDDEEGPCYSLNFVVPFREDPRPLYFIIRAVSDKWISAEAQITVNIKDIILPEGFAPSTPILPLDPLPITCLNNPEYEKLYADKGIKYFNPVQTQIFHMTYHTDENILIGAPTGSGKTLAAELCIFRLFNTKPNQKVIYIAPLKALVRERLVEWEKKFVQKLGKKMVELTGDFTPDVKLLKEADIVITTPEKWDGISRNWQNRSYVRDVGLIVMDEIHLLGSGRGAILEVITSRMRYISWNTQTHIRLMGLSTNMANATDLADWLGVGQRGLFNFKSSVRPVPLQISISGFSGKNYCPRMNSMNKPAYQAILRHSNNKPCLIFVSSRRQTRLTAMDLIGYCSADENPHRFLRMDQNEVISALELARDTHLKQFLQYGIGIHHAGLTPSDKKLVEELFHSGKIQVLVATSTLAWGVNLPAYFVIIKGTEFFEPSTKRYEDYPLVDVLQMAGRSGRPGFDTEGRVFIMVHDIKKNFYKRFLYEPFPIESSLHTQLHDHINAEIVSGTIKTKQDCLDYLTWTFMFRRLVQNPCYYGIEDLSYEGLNKWLSTKITSIIDDLEYAGLVKAIDLNLDKKKRWEVMASQTQSSTFGTMTAEKEKAEKEIQKAKGIYLEPTATGIIASFYYLSYRTASHFNRLIKADSNVNYLLELLCEAKEFAEIPVRHNEDKLNKELSEVVPLGVYMHDYESPHIKCYLLLQAHFERVKLPIVDYITDTRTILDSTIRISQSYIDICAEKGYLQPTINMMHILQMIMQARWATDSTLYQLFSNLQCPRENTESSSEDIHNFIQNLAQKENVTGLKQLLDVKYQQGESALQKLISKYLRKNNLVSNLMKIVEEFPYLTVKIDKVTHDEEDHQLEVSVNIERLSKPKEQAYTPMYTKQKDEGFWLIVSNPQNNELLALKRVRANRKFNRTEVYLPVSENDKELEAIVVPDCYLGLDVSSKFLCKIQTK